MPKKQIRDAGCTIHYIAEPIAGDAPESSLMEGVLESMAEYYSRQLRTNIKRGLSYNAQNGLCNGSKIFGYQAEPAPEFGKDRKKFAIDPATAPFVKKIFEDYVDGKPMVEIAGELNAMGIRTTRGNPFTVNSLASILKNRAYIGEYRYGGVLTPGGMPAIVSAVICWRKLLFLEFSIDKIWNSFLSRSAIRFEFLMMQCCKQHRRSRILDKVI